MYINNKPINIPKPLMVRREFNKKVFKNARLLNLDSITSTILANRKVGEDIDDIDKIINSNFKNAELDIYKLKDIKKAADRISDAIINKEKIGLLCDFDVDGISSAAVLYSSLVDYFNVEPMNIKPLISHRMMYGYGFRQEILDDIIAMDDKERPTLLITADEGSSDEERIRDYNKFMKEKGFDNADVIVTDHHHIKGQGPKSAFAVINPQREDDEFNDKTICGCTVALFVMVATRDSLIEKGYLDNSAPKLNSLLTYSTAATVADCVSMASVLNRAIVNKGLNDISNGTIPAWRIMKEHIVNTPTIKASSIGFGLGPRINACSRTGGDGLVALKYFLAEDDNEAFRYLTQLENMNEERKKIEKQLIEDAMLQASDLYSQGYKSLVIYLPEGHHGIHGIAASKICEKYGRPIVILSPKDYDEIESQEIKKSKGKNKKADKIEKNVYTVSGSGRSIEEINLAEILDNIHDIDPSILEGKYGGHSMAAGMQLNIDKINIFREMFEREVSKVLQDKEPHPIIKIDGELKENINIDFSILDSITKLEPYGNGFEEPIFKARILVQNNKLVGKDKNNQNTLQVEFVHNNFIYKGVIFNYKQHRMYRKIENNTFYDAAISITENYFRDQRQISIIIKDLLEVKN
tara:strand:- start:92908 stop:94821 length:1914 start_codon:yes stop_codon:yes gene_type:complete